MIVVADTSPLNYLILIEQVNILLPLFQSVIVPSAVRHELLAPTAPPVVRRWASDPPRWLEVREATVQVSLHRSLGAGEREAITIAQATHPNSLLLIDERLGRREALRLGLKVTGTLGILRQAHKHGLLDINEAIKRLRTTSFQASPSLLEKFRNDDK